MRLIGLSRQLAFAMGGIAAGVVILILLTSVVFYFFAFRMAPQDYPHGWTPTVAELVWLTATMLAAVGLAVLVAGHLAKRILLPLNSVAQAIRSVAAGNLSARASAGEAPLAEAVTLVDDFNRLANELKRVTDERAFWNAAIAHELRTPVTILRCRVQGLVDGVFEPDPAQFDRILSQVENLGRLVEDLRAVSLAESGHLQLEWQTVDLSGEVAEVADSFQARLEDAGLVVDLDLTFVPLACDPVRIRQVVVALLDNATRYSLPGTIKIVCRVDDGEAMLSVEDEGPGIPEDLVPHVFEAFRRFGDGRDQSYRSSGLGLAVVAAIAAAHGGRASCRSTCGGGTAFGIAWPQGFGTCNAHNDSPNT